MDMKTAAILGASSRTELHGSIRPYGGGDDSTKPTALTPPACLPQELSKRMTEKGPIGDPWWRFSSKLMGAAVWRDDTREQAKRPVTTGATLTVSGCVEPVAGAGPASAHQYLLGRQGKYNTTGQPHELSQGNRPSPN